MFDPISEITIDTPSFYLKKEGVPPDSFQVGFGSFEYLPTDSSRILFEMDPAAIAASVHLQGQGLAGVGLPFSQLIQSVFFLLFVVCLILLAFWINREGATLAANFRNILTGDTRPRTVFKEQITTSGVWSEVFLVFQFILILTMLLFTFLWDKGLSALLWPDTLFAFVAIFGGVWLFLFIKYLVYRLINYIFIEWDLHEWAKKYLRILELSGVLIFIPALFYIFAPTDTQVSFYLLIALFALIVFVFTWNLFNIFVKNKIGLLHFFLYLCAIEVAPFFIVYKGAVLFVNIAGN